MHDATVDRTTDASGPVSEFTADDLRGLDAGVWFGNEYAGEHVPALDAAAVLCHATGLWTNIEIKADDGEEAEAGHVIAREVKRLWPDASPSPLLYEFLGRGACGSDGVRPISPAR
jgi:glycerophosphoryl diester phosphodiesterase